jgi:hypothetical protein
MQTRRELKKTDELDRSQSLFAFFMKGFEEKKSTSI